MLGLMVVKVVVGALLVLALAGLRAAGPASHALGTGP